MRRVVGKAEYLPGGENLRFIVTSLSSDEYPAEHLYTQVYCARGEMENRIKEQQLFLFVCDVLGINNSRQQAISYLDDDEKMTVTTNDSHAGRRGGAQFLSIVNESGIYSLILRSRKPEANRFKRWMPCKLAQSYPVEVHHRTRLTPERDVHRLIAREPQNRAPSVLVDRREVATEEIESSSDVTRVSGYSTATRAKQSATTVSQRKL